MTFGRGARLDREAVFQNPLNLVLFSLIREQEPPEGQQVRGPHPEHQIELNFRCCGGVHILVLVL